MGKTAKDIQRRFVDGYQTGGDEVVLDELVADDFVDHSAAQFPPTKEGVRALFAMLRGAMPDLRAEVHDMIAEGDTVATRKTLIGTHRGELFGQAPTGAELRIGVIDFVRISDGQLKEHWNLVDTYGLMHQLGLIQG